MTNSKTVESRPATTMVSTREKALRWVFIAMLVAAIPSSSKVLADSGTSFTEERLRKAVAVTFAVDPQATVWRRTVEGRVNLLGPTDRRVTIGLTPSESSGERDLIVEFRVKLWFTEWVSPPEFLKIEELALHNRFPSTGRRQLSLSSWQRFQVWTRIHWGWAFLVLFLLVFLILRRVRRRSAVLTKVEAFRVDGFRLGKKIGEGAMGEVFEAVTDDGQPCAVKLLRPLLSESAEFRSRFDSELATYTKLSHPALPRLFGYGYAADGRSYMATELLKGRTLKEQLPAPLYQRRMLALDVLEQVGAVLDYLHQERVVHQDVKPSNIFLARNGEVKLLDLGIARRLEGKGEGLPISGTPVYMAPEQFAGKVDLRSDQYALGLVLYEVLTGRRPSEETDPKVLAHQRAEGKSPKTKISDQVDRVLALLLHPRPEGRYPSLGLAFSELKNALK